MAVEFGVLLPTREAVMSGRPETAPLLAIAERAEGAGFDSVWIGDSLTARPRHEPLTLLAAVAARTRRVRLGTGVLLPAVRNPVVLAHVVGTLDRIAEGRVLLGVGIAADAPAIRKEFAAAGVPWDRRVGRFLETIEICRALWRQEGASFSGKHFTLQDVTVEPKPHRAGGPPIWIGGRGATPPREGPRFDPRVPPPPCLRREAIRSLRWTSPRPPSCRGSSAAEAVTPPHRRLPADAGELRRIPRYGRSLDEVPVPQPIAASAGT